MQNIIISKIWKRKGRKLELWNYVINASKSLRCHNHFCCSNSSKKNYFIMHLLLRANLIASWQQLLSFIFSIVVEVKLWAFLIPLVFFFCTFRYILSLVALRRLFLMWQQRYPCLLVIILTETLFMSPMEWSTYLEEQQSLLLSCGS